MSTLRSTPAAAHPLFIAHGQTTSGDSVAISWQGNTLSISTSFDMVGGFTNGKNVFFYGKSLNSASLAGGPVYYKDGVQSLLPMTTEDKALSLLGVWIAQSQGFTVGKDIYLYGEGYCRAGRSHPIFYKNNSLYALPLTSPNGAVQLSGVRIGPAQHFIAGRDIYFYGMGLDSLVGGSHPIYYKNGELHLLPRYCSNTNAEFDDITLGANSGFSVGQDIYFYGTASNTDGSQQPFYFKNGVLHSLPLSTSDGKLRLTNAWLYKTQRPVVGHDIYLYGMGFNSSGQYPICYRNGVLYALPMATRDGRLQTDNIWLNDSQCFTTARDIYFYGTGSDKSGHYPVCYKNGALYTLPMSTQDGSIHFTAVGLGPSQGFAVGNNAYIYGVGEDHSGRQHPIYYKNGALHVLPMTTTDGATAFRTISLNGAQGFSLNEDVYLYGEGYETTGGRRPLYFKNNVLHPLPTHTNDDGIVLTDVSFLTSSWLGCGSHLLPVDEANGF